MAAMWKQESALDPTFAKINRCLEEDWFLLPFELRLQRAHAKTLEAADILSDQEHADLRDALDKIEARHQNRPCPDSEAEDLHTWIEGELTTAAGDAGRKIHTARSRNDQVATLLKMYVISSGRELENQLRELTRTACRRAKDWATLVLPLQTHCQFAAPGTAGFWALSYATGWDRVRDHVKSSVARWSRFCPLGAGAVAGSSIPIDRAIQAKELGFEQPATNALDATSRRDECVELLGLTTQTALHLQSFATDVIGFSQTPFRWTVIPPGFGTGSSMMPNKTNPDAMELLRGECNAILSTHQQAILLLSGLPSGYSRDLQCIKPILRTAVQRIASMGTMTNAFLKQLEFDPDRLTGALTMGNIDATLRMERKVIDGTPLRNAHHAVASDLRDARNNPPAPNAIHADAYQTLGSASPAETRRIADEMLATQDS